MSDSIQINPETGMSRFYARVFAIAATAGLAVLLLSTLRPFIIPGVWATLFAALLHPLNVRLKRRKVKPGLAAGLLTAGAALVIVLPVTVVGLIFARQAGELLQAIQQGAEAQHIAGLSDVLEHPLAQGPLKMLEDYAGIRAADFVPWIKTGAQRVVQFALSLSGTVFVGALGAVGSFFLVMFLLFFFVRDGEAIARTFVHLVPLAPGRRDTLLNNLVAVVRAVVFGTLVTALTQGTLVGIGFALVGLPSAIVFGVFAVLASLIPVVGTSLVWAPAALVLFAQGRTGAAIFMVLWGVVLVASVDNFLRPLLISGQTGVPTLVVFAGVLGGLAGFGFPGLFLGPLVLTLTVALVRYADELVTRARTPFEIPAQAPPPPPPPPPPAPAPGA